MTSTIPNFIGFIKATDPRWELALGKVKHDFFHLSAYLSASACHEGGKPLLFLLDAGDHGMLVPLIRRSLGDFGEAYADYSDITSPYGYPAPLYWGDRWESQLVEMHQQFDAFLKQQKVVCFFLRLNPFVGANEAQSASLGDVRVHGPTVYMKLDSEEESWRGINGANRTFIRRMLNHGCHVRIDEWDTIDTVIDSYYETMKRLDASPFYFFPKRFFEQLRDNTAKHFHMTTSYAPDGRITGGIFFTEVDGLIQYYLVGYFDEFTEMSPSKLSINAIRLWGLERGHHTLNLGGGLGARRDGLYEFKIRLAKSEANFSTCRKIILPEIYQALCKGVEDPDDEFFPRYRKTT